MNDSRHPDLFDQPPERAKLYDLKKGRQARDEGEESVREHSAEDWKNRYHEVVERWFLSLPVSGHFSGEDLRRAALADGLWEPHHPNAWGGVSSSVVRRWMRGGRIVTDGMTQATLLASHARRYPRYRKIW